MTVDPSTGGTPRRVVVFSLALFGPPNTRDTLYVVSLNRRSPAEKMEIIRVVEQSPLPVGRVLEPLNVPRSSLYEWCRQYIAVSSTDVFFLGIAASHGAILWPEV